MNCVLIRYGEIGTKSKRTRRWWEKIFMKNIRAALEVNNIKFSSIVNPRGRIIVSTTDKNALPVLKNVFGVSSISPAKKITKDLQKIKKEALLMYKSKAQGQTFRISTQRLDKQYALTSQTVNETVGAFIVEQVGAPVNLDYPDVDIGIEILHHAAYVFTKRIPGYGGIPVGIQGNVLVNLTDNRSAVAAWMMLKRGCGLVVHGDESFIPALESFSYGCPIVYVSDLQKAKKCLAIVFSEFNLGKRDIPSFYPLLGLTEQQIQEIETLIFGEKNSIT